jgi:hypothetical protein
MANDIVLSALKNACSCLPAQDGNLSFYTEITTANKNGSTEIGNDSILEKRENESCAVSDQWRVNVQELGSHTVHQQNVLCYYLDRRRLH